MQTTTYAILVLLLAGALSGPLVSAQSGPRKTPPPIDDRSAEALYQEANTYISRKYQEFNLKKLGFDPKLEAVTRQEQKALAARLATTLAARSTLTGTDYYYQGMLYHLADNSDGAIDSLRHFLNDSNGDGELTQNARAAMVVHTVRKNLLPEAEATIAQYAQHQPQEALERYGMETLVTDAFYKQKEYERMAGHAAEMLQAAKQLTPIKGDFFKRDDRLLKSVVSLSEAYRRLGKKDLAVAAVEDLRRIALALPSASLYRMATTRLGGLDPTADPLKLFDETNRVSAPPEISVTEWIEQKPSKISDLHGHVVLIDFWATWCGPCRFTFPKLRAWHAQFHDKGLVILGLTHYYGEADGRSVDRKEEFAYLQEFRKKNRLPYGFAVAPDNSNEMAFGVFSIPTSFLIDRRGQVRFIALGASDEQTSLLGKMIKKLVEEPDSDTK